MAQPGSGKRKWTLEHVGMLVGLIGGVIGTLTGSLALVDRCVSRNEAKRRTHIEVERLLNDANDIISGVEGEGWILAGPRPRLAASTAERARRKVDEALALDSDNGRGLRLRCTLAALTEEGYRGEVFCRRAVHIDDCAASRSALGQFLVSTGRPALGVDELRKAVQLAPGDGLVQANLAATLSLAGLHADAAAVARKAIQVAPALGLGYTNLGYALLMLGDRAAAADAYRSALERDERDIAALNGLASALNELGRWAEAEPFAQRAVALDPTWASGRVTLATSVKGLGRLPAAEAILRRAIELEPTLSVAHLNLGNTLVAEGKPDAAVAEWKRAEELAPSDPRPREQLRLWRQQTPSR